MRKKLFDWDGFFFFCWVEMGMLFWWLRRGGVDGMQGNLTTEEMKNQPPE
jgi:hypothetical protein